MVSDFASSFPRQTSTVVSKWNQKVHIINLDMHYCLWALAFWLIIKNDKFWLVEHRPFPHDNNNLSWCRKNVISITKDSRKVRP